MKFMRALENRTLFMISAALLVTTLLTLLSIYKYPYLNRDALTYLPAALAFQSHGLAASLAIYNWPFYQILIASISSVFSISVYHAAMAINIIFQTGMLLGMGLIAKQLNFTRRQLLILLTLFLLLPFLNRIRFEVIRDFGFWCFYLLGLYAFLRYSTQPTWRNNLLANSLFLLSTLFRLEGLLFTAILPLIFFWKSEWVLSERVHAMLRYWGVQVIVLLSVLCVIYFISGWSLDRLMQFLDFMPANLNAAKTSFLSEANSLKDQILHPYTAGFYKGLMLWLLLGSGLLKVLKAYSLGYLAIALSLRNTLTQLPVEATRMLLTVWGVSILIMGLFVLENHFLSERYTLIFILPALCFLPLGVDRAISAQYSGVGRVRDKCIIGVSLIVLLVYSFTLVFTISHKQIRVVVPKANPAAVPQQFVSN